VILKAAAATAPGEVQACLQAISDPIVPDLIERTPRACAMMADDLKAVIG
jgi:hypothetical protein